MLFIASDHAGFEIKEYLKKELAKREIPCKDFGAFSYKKTDDYPDFIIPLAKEVGKNQKKNRGIILGWSGQGEAIVANRIKGVRAALYYGGSTEIIKLSRTHNNSNILSLGGGFVSKSLALKIVLLWLGTPFSNLARHKRRIQKIDSLS
ncbi:RpiB/LacA/LacB family sugar-phosphate isomerase [Candidatus Uhrbacteria bacterium]|nr:RpiB/LacA/LacB family sugar-phosphate isomerase [Candidatus Uhrbacteria bacterium]